MLSGRLIRAQTFLRKKGIEIERRKSGDRIITIWRVDSMEPAPAEPAPTPKPPKSGSARKPKKAETQKAERVDWETGKFIKDDMVEGEI